MTGGCQKDSHVQSKLHRVTLLNRLRVFCISFFSPPEENQCHKKGTSTASQYCSLVGVITDRLCYGKLMYGSSAPNCRADRFVYAFIITVLRIQVSFFQRKSGLCLSILLTFRHQEKLKQRGRTKNNELLMSTEPNCWCQQNRTADVNRTELLLLTEPHCWC